jgi:NAD(P)-dependent dehydrogenase (short-subunit alcohol dehydrogenase family)
VTSGHDVVKHGRDQRRAEEAMRAVPGARTALAGDLASIEQTRALAEQANAAGPFQIVIHNAAIFRPNAPRLETVDGLEETFAVNVLAPYLLTALIAGPQRLVFLSSELHQIGQPDLSDLQSRRRWSGFQMYSNSKLFVVALAFGVARRWPHVLSNAVNPGVVPTSVCAANWSEAAIGSRTLKASGRHPEQKSTGPYSGSSNRLNLEAECLVNQDRGDSTWRGHVVDDENVVHSARDAVSLPGAAVLEGEAILVDASQSNSEAGDDLLPAYHKNHVASA